MNKRKTILIIIVGVFLFCKVSDSISVKLYKKYSKDGQYSVYGTKTFPDLLMPKMPGQGGDVEGTIYLYDEIENKILYSSKIPSIHLIYSSFEFSERTAYFVGDELVPNILTPWVLPRPIKNDYKKR
ncbi:hypothetical protein EQP59_05125 [Ornithobacterium rhinotracheale]|uniref:Uncharacterized protein n=1 Tax=Ornithobacterium rhinotracheale TaxID=28251 RepID=A0A410JRH2_ORNRH|nr:hypothetical protein [Ornithobacterium rhinotracheale]QAR30763.1 hypothetical protein EQP59_05125 [Ornithobacterium rhinotracheale]